MPAHRQIDIKGQLFLFFLTNVFIFSEKKVKNTQKIPKKIPKKKAKCQVLHFVQIPGFLVIHRIYLAVLKKRVFWGFLKIGFRCFPEFSVNSDNREITKSRFYIARKKCFIKACLHALLTFF